MLDELAMENARAACRAHSGPTLLGPGPRFALQRAVLSARDLRPGELLAGKYEVEELIGSGTASFVASARVRHFGHQVALRFLDPELVDHKEAARRFLIEAESAFRLRTDFALRVLRVEQLSSGQPFLVMERLAGLSLRTALCEPGDFSLARALKLALEACEALAAAHAIGIRHLGLKPEKLYLSQGFGHEQLKVRGLGSGHEQHASCHRVPTLNAGDVPLYIAPEQVRGATDLSDQTDIWSLGCVLFEMLCGEPAFQRPTLAQACAAVLEEDAPGLDAGRPDLSLGLLDVVQRCLEKDPRDRFENVVELAEALALFAPPAARVRAVRCARIFAEHGRLPRAHLRESLPAPAQRAISEESTILDIRRDSLDPLRLSASWQKLVLPELEQLDVRETKAPRRYGLALRVLLGLAAFALGCYLSFRPSPRPNAASQGSGQSSGAR